MSWHRIGFEKHRTQVVPTQLLGPYLKMLVERCDAVVTDPPTRIPLWRMDFGGMWISGTPSERVSLRGIELEVPSHHVDYAIKAIRKRAPERVAGMTYYGVVHWYFGLLLLPAQRHALLAKLVAIAPAARARVEAFDASVRANHERSKAKAKASESFS